jgi:dTDP-4-amino-4,6-dideoxygalactose transaminase
MMGRLRALRRYSYRVPWAVPPWGWPEMRATLGSVLGRVTEGPEVDRFAEGVKRYLGVRHVLPLNRGRTAIEVALRAMGVGAGDDVVVPAYVCTGVVEAITNTGARAAFADVGPDLHMGAEEVRAALTPATRCVIAVHLFGSTSAVEEIERLLAGTGIQLIDDAAQALGAQRGGKRIGTFGACGIVSCGPGKPLSGAAGACLVTDDAGLYERAAAVPLARESGSGVLLRTLGWWVWRRWRRQTLPIRVVLDRLFGEPEEAAHVNAPLSNLDAAIALRQLETLDARTLERRANARLLLERLPGLRAGLVGTPEQELVIKLIVVLPAEAPAMLDAIGKLADLGIECQRGYTPVHLKSPERRSLPVTERIWERVLCVPVDSPWHLPRIGMKSGWPFDEMPATVKLGTPTAAVP